MIRPAFVLALLLWALPVAAAEAPAPADKTERCPVCGMFVAPYPTWQATLVFADGQRLVFDGPKDLFRYLQEPSLRLPGRSPAEVRQVWVTEYYSAAPIPARDVFFIAGSDVMGPMGAELVPVKGRKQAETFMRDHGGRRVMVFDGRELKPVD